jgi:hypothetical protein
MSKQLFRKTKSLRAPLLRCNVTAGASMPKTCDARRELLQDANTNL